MHTSVHDPEPAVKRGPRRHVQLALAIGLPPAIPDKIIDDVGRFVRATWVGTGVPAEPDELYQDAVEAALETRHRYGHKIQGNGYSYLCGVAFRETKLRSLRALSVLSLSEKKAHLATSLQQRVAIRERTTWEDALDVPLRGERERRQKVARLIGRLDAHGRRLIAIACAEPDAHLHQLALRTKMGRARAAKVLRSLVRAVGSDPAFNHLRRVISRA